MDPAQAPPAPAATVVIPGDKKKFDLGSGSKKKKIILTVVGMLFLVGGVAAGALLVGQNQDIREKAGANCTQVCDGALCFESCKDSGGDWKQVGGHYQNTTSQKGQSYSTGSTGKGIVSESETKGQEKQAKKNLDYWVNEGVGVDITEADLTPDPNAENANLNSLSADSNTGTGPLSACWGLGGGQAERDCLANTPSGTYNSGGCLGLSLEACAALASQNEGWTVQSCTGAQEAGGTTRAGEFLSCTQGGTSTGGCGQVDVLDAGGEVQGFIIDKSGCGGGGTTTITSDPPPRDIPTTPPTTFVAQCKEIKIFDTSWVQITVADVQPGDTVYFTVRSTSSSGSFDKAVFYIDSVQQPETSSLRPTTQEFYYQYTIPISISGLDVGAVVHHTGQNKWY